jgi:hypothetical protein
MMQLRLRPPHLALNPKRPPANAVLAKTEMGSPIRACPVLLISETGSMK